MWLEKLFKLFKNDKVKSDTETLEFRREKIAKHEAAHGIVWYLFKNNWSINSLTIDKESLPDKSMDGALHITPNFDTAKEANIERANELFAIALAGMIGQNMNLLQDDNLLLKLGHTDFNNLFDKSGCSGDFEIARKFLPHLGKSFNITEGVFTQYKVMDLVNLFQNHRKVQSMHLELSQLLLNHGTLKEEKLISFFDQRNFQEYIEDENLDINFFHRK